MRTTANVIPPICLVAASATMVESVALDGVSASALVGAMVYRDGEILCFHDQNGLQIG